MSDNVEVGHLQAKISVDDTDVNKTVADLNREMKVTQSEFKKASAEVGDYGKSTDGLKVKSESLTKQINIQQQLVNKLRAEHEKSALNKGEDAKQTQNLEIRYNQAATALANMNNELKKTNNDIDKQIASWTKVGNALDGFANKMDAVGRKMSSVGTDMTMAITVPLAAVGGLATKASIDFESAFAGVKKTVNGSEEELTGLSDGIRNLSKEIPAAATSIASVAEAAGQLGIATPNIMAFTRTMIDLGESTNLSSEEAAASFARFSNIVGMSQNDFDKLGSATVALGNSMATTEAEIVAMAMRLAAQGKQAGMTEAQIFALAATMSSLGVESEAGGTAMTQVMKKIQSAIFAGGKELDAFAAASGVTSKTFATTWMNDPVKAIELFTQGLGKSGSEGKNLTAILDKLGISGIRESDAILRLAGSSDLLSQAVATSSQAWEENTALAKEADQRYGTSASQLAVFKNQVNDTAITLGNSLIPALMGALEAAQPLLAAVGRMAEGFAELDPSMQSMIITMAAVTAAVGPMILIAGKFAMAIGSITTAVRLLSTTLATLMLNPYVLAFGALVGAVVLVTTSIYSAKKATEELKQAQEELQRVQRDGVERNEIEMYDEKIKTLEELKETYLELIEVASASGAAQNGNNLLALDSAAKELGVRLKDVAKTAREFGIELEFVDENGTLSAVTMGKLEEAMNIYAKATADARRETTQEISEQARKIAMQNNEIKSTEDLLKTYRTAKSGSDEWKQAQSELSSMFPQFTTELGVNAEAIEGLMVVKRQEIELAWQSMQVKAMEIRAYKEASIAEVEASINSIRTYAEAVAVADGRIQKLKQLRSEVEALNALIGAKPGEGFKFTSAPLPTPEKPPPTGKYQNPALDAAYRAMEHMKRLDQLTVQQEIQTLETIKSRYVKTADERMVMAEKLHAAKKTLLSQELEAEKKLYDTRMQIAEKSKDRESELLDEATQKYRNAVEDKLIRSNLTAEQQFNVQKQMHDNIIRDSKSYLERVLADEKYSAEEKDKIQKQITEVIRTNINERLKLEQDYYAEIKRQEIEGINKLSQGVQAALREKYQAEKTAGEQNIKNAMDANEAWRRNTIDGIKSVHDYKIKAAESAANIEIDRINSVLGVQIQAIQDELSALDKAEQQKSRDEMNADDEKKIARLKAKMDYEPDEYNKLQLQKEINKILADQEKRHNDEQLSDKKEALKEQEKSLKDKLKEETDLVKQQLADKKELLNISRDAEVAQINYLADYQKTSLENALLAHQNHYNQLLLAKVLQAQAEKMIVENQQKEIIKLLEGFGTAYEVTGQTLGEKMYEGFKMKVDQIQTLIASVNAQIDSVRNAAVSAMNQAAQAAATKASASTVNNNNAKNVTVQNNFVAPVTSPSDVSKATKKMGQALVF